MIEILNVHPIKKGTLLASCDVRIVPWKFTFHRVTIFEKGAQRWMSLPSEKYTNDAGEVKYKPLGSFDSPEILERFRGQIMKEIDKYLEKNPDLKPEDVVKETDELPF